MHYSALFETEAVGLQKQTPSLQRNGILKQAS